MATKREEATDVSRPESGAIMKSKQTSPPPRPVCAPPVVENIPLELRERAQWVCWRYQRNKDRTDWTKVPIDASTLKSASSKDERTWTSFQTAMSKCSLDLGYDGVGFVFSPNDPYCGIDLDDCIGANGLISPEAQAINDECGSYAEISPSGTGVKIILKGAMPGGGGRQFSTIDGRPLEGMSKIECYSQARFFTVTGRALPGSPTEVRDGQEALDRLVARCNAKPEPSKGRASGKWEPAAGSKRDDRSAGTWRASSLSDDALIERARDAKNGDKFSRLWAGDTSEYGGDESRADLAFCDMLAFWTGKDADQMDRIFRKSGLMREKWDENRGARTYGQMTIEKAIEGCSDTYSPERSAEPSAEEIEADLGEPPDGWKGLPTTDLCNARRLVERFGDRIRYCHPMGCWFIWTGQRWERDLRGTVESLASQVSLIVQEEAKAASGIGVRNALVRWAKSSRAKARISAMVELAKSIPGQTLLPDDLDAGPMLLNVRNGTIDLRTGKLRLHDRSDLITRLSDVEYDPSASCPRFDLFMKEVLPDAAVRAYLIRYLGMCLTGDISEQILVICHGAGGNGKSVLLDTVQAIMGDYASLAAPTLLVQSTHSEHPTEIADLMGRRLVVASETEKGARLKLQLVKRLTGDASLKGRFMRQDFFEFERTHKLLMITNNRPRVDEDSEAAWRRLRLIPFDVVVPAERRDPDLLESLCGEFPGILRRLVDGCLEWQRAGLGTAPGVEAATAEYRRDEDEVGRFFEECLEIEEVPKGFNPQAFETWEALRKRYEWWCGNEGVDPVPQGELQRAFASRGLETETRRVGGKSAKVRLGVRFRSSLDQGRTGREEEI
ncbi:MAG: hypothetical protein KF768_13750, partial [Phycisphaeraceae bacterium]|nr:hypothetical protein [Phycisphaeraceae bacterium]